MLIPNIKAITQKRLKQLQRNASSAEYKEWKFYILDRDNHKCQYPMCNKKDKLQVHHIKRFADNPSLRTETFNGITLCQACHAGIYGKEQFYEMMFFEIVKANEQKYKTNKET